MTTLKLLKKAKYKEPDLRIGKNGLSESIINEVKEQLEKKSLVKIKFLSSALDSITKKQLVDTLVQKTGATLVHKVGLVATLYQEKAPRLKKPKQKTKP